MPTPRAHGGAALQPINLVSPAFFGLNTENEAALLGPEWATTLNNVIFDRAGRIATRKGWQSVTSTPGAAEIERVHEFRKADGTAETIMTTSADILRSATSPTSIIGVLTLADPHISLVNFNDKMIGFNEGVIVWTGTGDFTAVSAVSGTAPNGTIGMSAYGRLWGVDVDGHTIRYSALLDETRWDPSDGGGVIDMSQVWPRGQDEIVALAEFNGDIVVFGRNHVVFWTDGRGATLGVDPEALYVADTLQGVGAISQHAIEGVTGDLWFLTPNGVTSLGRVVVSKSNPQRNISKNVQNFVGDLHRQVANPDTISMSYSPQEDIVILTFPDAGRCIIFDARQELPDTSFRAASWTCNVKGMQYMRSGAWFGSLTGSTGEVFQYTGYDDDGESFTFSYESGWLNFGEEVGQYLKILKRIGSVTLVEASTDILYSWEFDFGVNSYQITRAAAGGLASEFNIAEFSGFRIPADSEGIAEYSGGIALRVIPVPTRGTGQYIKVGVEVDTNNASFALQQLTLFAKIGRVA